MILELKSKKGIMNILGYIRDKTKLEDVEKKLVISAAKVLFEISQKGV